MVNCTNCNKCIWNNEYSEVKNKPSDAWKCEDRKENINRLSFPFENIECNSFILNFWKSEFVKEINKDKNSLEKAILKYKEKYIA